MWRNQSSFLHLKRLRKCPLTRAVGNNNFLKFRRDVCPHLPKSNHSSSGIAGVYGPNSASCRSTSRVTFDALARKDFDWWHLSQSLETLRFWVSQICTGGPWPRTHVGLGQSASRESPAWSGRDSSSRRCWAHTWQRGEDVPLHHWYASKLGHCALRIPGMPGSTLRYFSSLTFRWIMVESETLFGHWMKKIWLFSF